MFNYWPIVLIVTSNVLYHFSARSLPKQANQLLSLFITYLIGATITIIVYFATTANASPARDVQALNWVTLAMGFFVVGMELGTINMYRVGWNLSVGPLVANISGALVLLLVGVLILHEKVSWSQGLGIILCLSGLILIRR
ncbi:MAG: hypothetical protein GX933_00255 [Chloroflexi bacterium]|nr:hypothetical protein [Chloroflexota bacterium]